MDWNCTATEERLSDFLEGTLAAEEASAFAAHASACARCQELVAQVGDLVKQMRQISPLEEPPLLRSRILDVTLGPRKRQQAWEGWFSWLPLIWQPKVAFGIATVAASLVIVMHAAGVKPSDLKNADLRPASVARAVNRQVHLTYAHGAKFVNDLRVVYEIQSRLTPQAEPEPAPATPPESEPSTFDPKQKSMTAPHFDHKTSREQASPRFMLTSEAAEEGTRNAARRLL